MPRSHAGASACRAGFPAEDREVPKGGPSPSEPGPYLSPPPAPGAKIIPLPSAHLIQRKPRYVAAHTVTDRVVNQGHDARQLVRLRAYSSAPPSRATHRSAAWVRDWTWSFARMLDTLFRTVLSCRPSLCAMSLFDSPSAKRSRMRRSCGVRVRSVVTTLVVRWSPCRRASRGARPPASGS